MTGVEPRYLTTRSIYYLLRQIYKLQSELSAIRRIPDRYITMLDDAINYPRSGTDPAKTILIGGVLLLLSVLLVPAALVTGYVVRVVRSVSAGEGEPPAFEAWGELLVEGAKGMAVVLAYVVVPTVALGGVVAAGALLGTRIGAAVALLGVLVTLPLWLAAWYVGSAGFINFAVTGRLRAAFEFGTLRPILTSGAFATAWLLGVGVLVVGGVVAGVIGAVPIVGLLGAFVSFYATVAAAYCYARGFDDATSVGSAPEPPEVDPAV